MKGYEGIDEVMRRLNEEVSKIEKQTLAGLIKSAILIRRSMESTSPKVPIDLGNLNASFFVVTSQSGPPVPMGGASFKGKGKGKMASEKSQMITVLKSEIEGAPNPTLIMGFSANYAITVHENMEGKFKRPGAGPKFFESALARNHLNILKIIALNVKL